MVKPERAAFGLSLRPPFRPATVQVNRTHLAVAALGVLGIVGVVTYFIRLFGAWGDRQAWAYPAAVMMTNPVLFPTAGTAVASMSVIPITVVPFGFKFAAKGETVNHGADEPAVKAIAVLPAWRLHTGLKFNEVSGELTETR